MKTATVNEEKKTVTIDGTEYQIGEPVKRLDRHKSKLIDQKASVAVGQWQRLNRQYRSLVRQLNELENFVPNVHDSSQNKYLHDITDGTVGINFKTNYMPIGTLPYCVPSKQALDEIASYFTYEEMMIILKGRPL